MDLLGNGMDLSAEVYVCSSSPAGQGPEERATTTGKETGRMTARDP